MTDPTPKTTAKSAAQFDTSQFQEVIDALHSRSKQYEATAKNYVIAIGISIAIGFGVFVLAGTIAAIDEVDFYNETKGISNKLYIVQGKLDKIAATKDQKDVISPPISNEIQLVLKDIEEATAATKRLESSFQADAKETESIHRRHLISTVTTRISAASLLAFLVAILANLYRHNVRLAAFYNSRYDAMRLSKSTGLAAFEKNSKLLFPDGLDVGKNPNTPTKQTMEFAKEILKLFSSKYKGVKIKGDSN